MSADFLQNSEISQAIELIKESAYTQSELESYDRYWDSISTEKTLLVDAFDEGKIEGKIETAKALKTLGVDLTIIAQSTGLSVSEIDKL